MARFYKWVTICAELFTIAVWIDVLNFHLPLGSLRGWLLATGEGRRKSTTKSSLASNQHSIWMQCLKAEVGGTAHSGTPSRISRLTDYNVLGSCSRLIAGPRYTRVWHSALNDVCGASVDEAVWSTTAEDAMGGHSLSLPKVCPRMPKLKSSRCSMIRSC